LDRIIQLHLGLQPDTLDRINLTMEDQADRQIFAIWRDVVSGVSITVWHGTSPHSKCTLSNLSSGLLNRPRQREEYIRLSSSWGDRQGTAMRFKRYSFFSDISELLFAIRCDCLLEASLAAIDLSLIEPAEDAQLWWRIGRITTARSACHVNPDTWQSTWAEIWAALSTAILAAISLCPMSTSQASEYLFHLRCNEEGMSATDSHLPYASYGEWVVCWDSIQSTTVRKIGKLTTELIATALREKGYCSSLSKRCDEYTGLDTR
jgi:hypothetical protein